MDRQLLQRLVGTLVLVLLALVFLLFLLQSPESEQPSLEMSIPSPPATPEVNLSPVVSDEQQQRARQQIADDREEIIAASAEPEPADEQSVARDEPPAAESPAASEPAPAASEQSAPTQPDEHATASQALAGFVVQVASFGSRENADALVQRLSERGYRAFVEASRLENGRTLYRVNVGPEIRRQEAEQSRDRLNNDSEFQFDGLLRRFVP